MEGVVAETDIMNIREVFSLPLIHTVIITSGSTVATGPEKPPPHSLCRAGEESVSLQLRRGLCLECGVEDGLD